MYDRKFVVVAAVLALGLVVAPGCVSKKMFKKNTESTDSRMASVESAVEANERRLGDMKNETDQKISAVESQASQAKMTGDQAMSKATSAEGMAEKAWNGRLLWEVKLSDDKVKFNSGRYEVDGSASSALDSLVGRVKGMGKAVYLEIEGHTDSTGGEASNMTLGYKRAMAVRDYLSQQSGLPLHVLNVVSYGEANPVADNSTRDGRAQNRRVVIKVLE